MIHDDDDDYYYYYYHYYYHHYYYYYYYCLLRGIEAMMTHPARTEWLGFGKLPCACRPPSSGATFVATGV